MKHPTRKELEDTDPEFLLHFTSLMNRLLKAGVITHYEEGPGPDGEVVIEWNPDYSGGMGGEASFLALSTLLADICTDRPLSTDEQAMIQIIRQLLWDTNGVDRDRRR